MNKKMMTMGLVSTLAAFASGQPGPLSLVSAEDVGAKSIVKNPFPAPRNQAELDERMAELRKQYEPYLQSLPKPLNVRTRKVLEGPWKGQDEDKPKNKFDYVSTYESGGFHALEDGYLKADKAPTWWNPDLDDSAWKTVEVPGYFRTWSPPADRSWEKVVWYRTSFQAAVPKIGERAFLHFGGADHRAQVWLNGVFVGEHTGYFEDFRLDVTGALRVNNTLAVRLINGYFEGTEPVATLPDAFLCADKERTLAQWKGGGHGNGCGLFRPVVLEMTGTVMIRRILVRGRPENVAASLDLELDAQEAGEVDISVEIIPENFDGRSYQVSSRCRVEHAVGRQLLQVPCPEARLWSQETPRLYRCRVSLRRDGRLLDAADALFGFRTIAIATGEQAGIRRGQFVLNGQPIFLRGACLQYLNVSFLWGEPETAIKTLLMMKAAHFNFMRNIQHIPWPETLELQDRLGFLYETEANPSRDDYWSEPLVALGEDITQAAARVCYNNPGMVMLCLQNEGNWFKVDGRRFCAAVWKADPERIIKPSSGGWPHLPAEFWKEHFTRLVAGHHDYNGWYPENGIKTDIRFLAAGLIGCTPQHPGFNGRGESSKGTFSDAGHLYTIGEYGGEGKDAMESFASYPKQWGNPPPPETIGFWHPSQAERMGKPDDPASRYAIGLRGRLPKNMADMIEASQVYQADQLSGLTRGYRLGSAGYAGYEQYHFKDMLPNQWQKCIVSYDFRPKKGYFEVAQCNQPIVPLFVIDKEDQMTLWVDNDLAVELGPCTLKWRLFDARGVDLKGQSDVPSVAPLSSVKVQAISLKQLPDTTGAATIALELIDRAGAPIARYEREIYLPAMRPVVEKP